MNQVAARVLREGSRAVVEPVARDQPDAPRRPDPGAPVAQGPHQVRVQVELATAVVDQHEVVLRAVTLGHREPAGHEPRVRRPGSVSGRRPSRAASSTSKARATRSGSVASSQCTRRSRPNQPICSPREAAGRDHRRLARGRLVGLAAQHGQHLGVADRARGRAAHACRRARAPRRPGPRPTSARPAPRSWRPARRAGSPAPSGGSGARYSVLRQGAAQWPPGQLDHLQRAHDPPRVGPADRRGGRRVQARQLVVQQARAQLGGPRPRAGPAPRRRSAPAPSGPAARGRTAPSHRPRRPCGRAPRSPPGRRGRRAGRPRRRPPRRPRARRAGGGRPRGARRTVSLAVPTSMPAVQLHRVGVDHLAAQRLRERQAQLGLAGRRRADHGHPHAGTHVATR